MLCCMNYSGKAVSLKQGYVERAAQPPAGILLGIKVAIYEPCPMRRRRSRSRSGARAQTRGRMGDERREGGKEGGRKAGREQVSERVSERVSE